MICSGAAQCLPLSQQQPCLSTAEDDGGALLPPPFIVARYIEKCAPLAGVIR